MKSTLNPPINLVGFFLFLKYIKIIIIISNIMFTFVE